MVNRELKPVVWKLKSTFISLTLFYFNFLSVFFFTSFFFYYFLSFTPDEDHGSKALVFLTVLYVSSYRWGHFSRAVLFCQLHQLLFTHSLALPVWGQRPCTAAWTPTLPSCVHVLVSDETPPVTDPHTHPAAGQQTEHMQDTHCRSSFYTTMCNEIILNICTSIR